jgi:5-(carboxyamino)imidazole ribonucleotide mutase
MPAGIPVATVALNGAANAGLLAVRILGSNDSNLASKLDAYQQELADKVMGTLEEPERLGLSFQRKSTI